MRRFLTGCLVSVAMLVAVAPGARAAGNLRVGTEPNFPPLSYKEAGQIRGFEIDLINDLARAVGKTASVRNVAFPEQPKQLSAGKLDVAISSWTITPEREKTMRFTDSYFDAGQVIVINRSKSQARTKADLASMIVGVQTDTTGEQAAKARLTYKALKGYPDVMVAFKDLEKGQLGAVVIDLPVALAEMKREPVFKIIGGAMTSERYGIAVSPRHPELVKQLNLELGKMKADGRYRRLYSKWFGV